MFSLPQLGVSSLLPGVTAAASAVPGTELPTNQSIPGKIKAWYEEKGFGFVTPDIPGPDVFLHKNQLTDVIQLAQGTPVSFQARFNPSRGKYEVTSCQAAGVAPDVAKASIPATGGWAVQDNLFIAGLPITADEQFVKDYFAKYGMVAQCKVLPDQPGKVDRAALVRFADAGQARWLVDNLNGTTPEGLSGPLTVRFAGDRPGAIPGQAAVASFGPVGAVTTPMSPYGVPSPAAGSDALASALTQLIPGLAQPQLLQGLPAMGNLGQLAPAQSFGGTPQVAIQGLLPQPQVNGTMPLAALPSGVGPDGQTTVAQPQAPIQGLLPQPQVNSTMPLAALPSAVGVDGQPSAAPPQALNSLNPQPMVSQPVLASNGAAPLNQGADLWLQASDPASGRPYYYHALTREVRWDKPA